MMPPQALGGKTPSLSERTARFGSAPRRSTAANYRAGTDEEELPQRIDLRQLGMLTLHGKSKAGFAAETEDFGKAAEQFEKEHTVITEGQRSGFGSKATISTRLHPIPFFGDLGVSKSRRGRSECRIRPHDHPDGETSSGVARRDEGVKAEVLIVLNRDSRTCDGKLAPESVSRSRRARCPARRNAHHEC